MGGGTRDDTQRSNRFGWRRSASAHPMMDVAGSDGAHDWPRITNAAQCWFLRQAGAQVIAGAQQRDCFRKKGCFAVKIVGATSRPGASLLE